MKRLILILAMVVVATISYGQNAYKIIRVAGIDKSSGERNVLFDYAPQSMFFITGDGAAKITDSTNSRYTFNTSGFLHENDEAKSTTWEVTDEKGTNALMLLVFSKKRGELWLSVVYGQISFMYQLDPNYGSQKQ